MEALSVPTALPRARVKRAVMPEPAHHALSRSVAGLLGILLLLCSAVCLVLDFLREPLTKAWHAANTARACEEYYQQGDFDEALAACDAAIAASPTSAPAYITRGYIYMVRGNYRHYPDLSARSGQGLSRRRKLCKPQQIAMTRSRTSSFQRRMVSLRMRQRLMLLRMCSMTTRRCAT